MSISSEISRLSGNVTSAFGAVSQMGGTVPSGANSDDLAASIRSIPQSGGTSDVIWVTADANFQTFTVSNISHTYSEILAAFQAGKIVKIKFSGYLSATDYVNVIGELRLVDTSSSQSSRSFLNFDMMMIANFGNGDMLMHIMFRINDDDTNNVGFRIVNTTNMS